MLKVVIVMYTRQVKMYILRALVAENQVLRQRVAEVSEAFVAECDEHRICQMKHHLCKEREEVLLSENRQLKEKIKQ